MINNHNKHKKLKKSFESYHKKSLKKLKKTQTKALANVKSNTASILGGALLAGGITTVGSAPLPSNSQIVSLIGDEESASENQKNIQKASLLTSSIDLLKQNPSTLSLEDEKKIEQALSFHFSVPLKVTLDGNRLNEVWGYFGQEQHLYRWQGDNLSSHSNFHQYGIAPATGAFGYFDNALQEEYYIAAPIHLLPNWNTDWPTLKPWYKFRKVLVYNPKNDRAVVAVIGDAGPAKWTGKQFGGSPEVMNYLDMYDGSAKSRAVVLFIDESSGKVELGPINPSSNLVASIK